MTLNRQKTAEAVRRALSIAKARPIFHSERDLQLEFGCALRAAGFERVRAEKRFVLNDGDIIPDIVADRVAFELKEKAKKCSVSWAGERFDLKGSSGFGRDKAEGFHDDIRKLGRLIGEVDGIDCGFALLLTSRNIRPDIERRLKSDLPDVEGCKVWLEDSGEWGKVENVITRYFLVEVCSA